MVYIRGFFQSYLLVYLLASMAACLSFSFLSFGDFVRSCFVPQSLQLLYCFFAAVIFKKSWIYFLFLYNCITTGPSLIVKVLPPSLNREFSSSFTHPIILHILFNLALTLAVFILQCSSLTHSILSFQSILFLLGSVRVFQC